MAAIRSTTLFIRVFVITFLFLPGANPAQAQGAILDLDIPVSLVSEVAPGELGFASENGALHATGSAALAERGDTVVVTPVLQLLEELPTGAGLDIPGISLADEYSENLVDYDPESRPPRRAVGGQCWVANPGELMQIRINSPDVDALPTSPAISVRVVCSEPSRIRLVPQQHGRDVRDWRASLLPQAGGKGTLVSIGPRSLGSGVSLGDAEYFTVENGDALHRVEIDWQALVYEGPANNPQYPRRGGKIAAEGISLQIVARPAG